MPEKKGESLAGLVRRLREAKHWSQANLARETGLTKSHVDAIESGRIKRPRTGVCYKLAAALGERYEVFLLATGAVEAIPLKPTQQAAVQQLLEVLPVELPVYITYPREYGMGEMVGVTYRAKAVDEAGRRIEAYQVPADSLRPLICANDIVVVDRDNPPASGDYVVARKDGTMILGNYLRELDGAERIATDKEILSSFTDMALVIEIIHRLKK